MDNPLSVTPDGIGALLADYAARASNGDLMLDAAPASQALWRDMLGGLADLGGGAFGPLQERVTRQVADLGMAFRLTGEDEERSWPLSPVPLLIQADEWNRIKRGMAQRAELLERVVRDIYGPGTLISSGALPAPVVTGSPHFWRQMINARPPGNRYLHFYSADLARGPDGEWRVLADGVRAPTGAGYALENRLAMARVSGDLLGHMNVRRLAPFFTAFRQGLAAVCERVEPRIALLTPGRFNQSYAEQAHLARYLGFLLVEGDDLVVRDHRLYVRTIEGLKRIDAVWRRMDTTWLDPLTFDAGSRIGVPDLFDAIIHGGLVTANQPGVGVVESRAFAAFLPRLAQAMLGEDLMLPNIATWWCGQPAERAHVLDTIGDMAIGSAFGQSVAVTGKGSRIGANLDAMERSSLWEAMAARPMDYVGQELVQLSTAPAVIDGRLTARPFTLRVFMTRDGDGVWRTMPGGFARLAAHGDLRAVLMGDGDLSADVCIVGDAPEAPISLLDTAPSTPIRRSAGTLPSKAADNLFWMTRYLERAEATLRVVRALLGGSIEADGGGALDPATMDRLVDLLQLWGAIPPATSDTNVMLLCRAAIGGPDNGASVQGLTAAARAIGQGMRERLAVDYWRLLARPLNRLEADAARPMLEQLADLIDRYSALSGLAAENMGRSQGWRFLELGRRIERAITVCRLLRQFAFDGAGADDLTVLLDICDSQISYRTRYLSGLSLHPVRDLVGLETHNPRSLAYQVALIGEHLAALPALHDDGMPEPPARIAAALTARLAEATADRLGEAELVDVETRLLALSDAIAERYFLKSRTAERAVGMRRLA